MIGYNLVWPSRRCCAFNAQITPDGHALVVVSVATEPQPTERRRKIVLGDAEVSALRRTLTDSEFFDLPEFVGVSPIDGDIRRLKVRMGAQYHSVEIYEWAADTPTGAAEKCRADAAWNAVRTALGVEEVARQ